MVASAVRARRDRCRFLSEESTTLAVYELRGGLAPRVRPAEARKVASAVEGAGFEVTER